jgi:hypothetical protein
MSKFAGLGYKNGFALVYVVSLLRLVKAQQSCAPEREHCNEYDLTAGPCF